MRKLHLTWDVVVAAMVLLLSAYIVFLGILYRENSTLEGAIALALGLIVSIGLCIYGISYFKAHKNHRFSVVGQVVMGVFIVGLFVAASLPFTNFISVWLHKGEIAQKTEAVKSSAIEMDQKYNEYVATRISKYNPVDTLRRASLRRHLLPDGIDSIQRKRSTWIESIGDMRPWNIAMPTNLDVLRDCTSKWVSEYIKLAAIQYDDEANFDEFTYKEFDEELKELLENLSQPGFSIWALLISLFAASVMFLPYLFMRAVPKRKTDDLWEDYYNDYIEKNEINY